MIVDPGDSFEPASPQEAYTLSVSTGHYLAYDRTKLHGDEEVYSVTTDANPDETAWFIEPHPDGNGYFQIIPAVYGSDNLLAINEFAGDTYLSLLVSEPDTGGGYFEISRISEDADEYHVTAVDYSDQSISRLLIGTSGSSVGLGPADLTGPTAQITIEVTTTPTDFDEQGDVFDFDEDTPYQLKSENGFFLAGNPDADPEVYGEESSISPDEIFWEFTPRAIDDDLVQIKLSSDLYADYDMLFIAQDPGSPNELRLSSSNAVGGQSVFDVRETEPGSEKYFITATNFVDPVSESRVSIDDDGVATLVTPTTDSDGAVFTIHPLQIGPPDGQGVSFDRAGVVPDSPVVEALASTRHDRDGGALSVSGPAQALGLTVPAIEAGADGPVEADYGPLYLVGQGDDDPVEIDCPEFEPITGEREGDDVGGGPPELYQLELEWPELHGEGTYLCHSSSSFDVDGSVEVHGSLFGLSQTFYENWNLARVAYVHDPADPCSVFEDYTSGHLFETLLLCTDSESVEDPWGEGSPTINSNECFSDLPIYGSEDELEDKDGTACFTFVPDALIYTVEENVETCMYHYVN